MKPDERDAGMEAWGISVEIGAARLVDDVSLDLIPGNVTCLLGPNGAGKSTLLRVLSGVLEPGRGEVQFCGRALGRWSADELARHRAVLSQNTALSFAFRVVDVVALGRSPHVRQSSAALDRWVIEAAMAAADVTHLADRGYATLSGGEQQRVQLARVLAQLMNGRGDVAGKLLMLDEPTASLDLAHQQQVLAIARNFAHAGGAVLAVLHDLNLAASVADQLYLMKAGRLVSSGRPAEVLTAEMIGDVFAIEALILDHPKRNIPLVVTSASPEEGLLDQAD